VIDLQKAQKERFGHSRPQAGAAAGLALIQKEEAMKLQQASAKKPEAL
jgi:hypothetical protein